MVAKYELNENGQFSADFQPSWDSLSCMKLSLKVKSKMSFFSERQSYFKEKNYSLFAFLLGASYMQKTSEFEFSSLAEEI